MQSSWSSHLAVDAMHDSCRRAVLANAGDTGGKSVPGLARMREVRRACKPGSVSRCARDGDHLSSLPTLAGTRWNGTALPPWSSSQPGDEPGAHSPSIRPCSRWGLAAAASPQTAGRSYRPISPLPRSLKGIGAVCFCATFRLPRRTDPLRKPGRYPAPCPVEPGLSSP